MPLAEDAAQDPSWRVRKGLVRTFGELCQHVGTQVTVTMLVPVFAQLLQDDEAEVRSFAIKQMLEVAKAAGTTACGEHIAPVLKSLGADPHEGCRCTFLNSNDNVIV